MRSWMLSTLLALGVLSLGCSGSGGTEGHFSRPLPIPPILEPTQVVNGVKTYDLQPQVGHTSFFEGKTTKTWGYNGNLLGPTLRFQRGDQILMRVTNALPVTTTVHWRGISLDGPSDGGPFQPIAPGAQWMAAFTVDQPAATLIYHPHPDGATGRQVTMGLGGFLLVDDPIASALSLPQTYGVDDFPLVIQDRRFNADGSFSYMDRPSDQNGFVGDQILVNGVANPFLQAPATAVRLRLVNGSNSRSYCFAFSDGRRFQLIATDQGLLPGPVPTDLLQLSPGERAEIVVDLSSDSGRDLYLESRAFSPDGDQDPGVQGGRFPLMRLEVRGPSHPAPVLPSTFGPFEVLREADAVRVRTFALEQGVSNSINGQQWDPNRVDEVATVGDTEIWELHNYADASHSFDLHNSPFQVLSRSSGEVHPWERGWKEVVFVAPGETVQIIVRFTNHTGRFVYHCALLEDMDLGMMGCLVVQDRSH